MRRARACAATRGVTASRAHAHVVGAASEDPPQKRGGFPMDSGAFCGPNDGTGVAGPAAANGLSLEGEG